MSRNKKEIEQAAGGVLVALLVAVIVLGSLTLAAAENNLPLAALPAQVMDIGLPLLPARPPAAERVKLASDNSTQAEALPAFAQPYCPVPTGWKLYVIQPDDTLKSLVERSGVAPEDFTRNNCLVVESLLPGTIVYIPAFELAQIPAPQVAQLTLPEALAPEGAAEPARENKKPGCGPPAWWVNYVVRSGDTLYSLGLSVGASVPDLQQANCLGSSTLIRTGQRLSVPRLPAAAISVGQPRRSSPAPTATPLPPPIYPTLPNPTDPPIEPPPPTEEPPPPTEEPPPPTEEPPPPPTEEPPPPPTEEPPRPTDVSPPAETTYFSSGNGASHLPTPTFDSLAYSILASGLTHKYASSWYYPVIQFLLRFWY